MDLVVGATGLVGGQVARGLLERGRDVRCLVREPAGRADASALHDIGAEIVAGDLTEPGSLAAACRDVEVVVCSVTSMPDPGERGLQEVDREGVLCLVEAAEATGVERFVYVSFSGNMEHPSPLRDAKRAAERRLAESPMRAVVLRPSFFMEVWLGPHLGFDPATNRMRIYGSGEAPVSYVSAGDVAAFAVATAVEAGDGDETLELGGPEALSQRDVVGLLAAALGGEPEIEPVPLEAIRAQYASENPLARAFGALMLTYAEGDAIPGSQRTAARHGITLRSVGEWVEEVAERSGD